MSTPKHPSKPSKHQQLEARIVAAALGECSTFEHAELKREIAELPDEQSRQQLLTFQHDIQSTHGLLAETGQQDRAPWTISAKKRKALLATLATPPAPQTPGTTETTQKTTGSRRIIYAIPLAAAAAFLLLIPFMSNIADSFANVRTADSNYSEYGPSEPNAIPSYRKMETVSANQQAWADEHELDWGNVEPGNGAPIDRKRSERDKMVTGPFDVRAPEECYSRTYVPSRYPSTTTERITFAEIGQRAQVKRDKMVTGTEPLGSQERMQIDLDNKLPPKALRYFNFEGKTDSFEPNAGIEPLPSKSRLKSSLPAEYETVTEKVLTEEASTRLEVVPTKYDTREVRVEVSQPSTRVETTPAKFETVTEKVLTEEASTRLQVVPAKYDTREVRVERKGISTRIETIPAKYETVTETIGEATKGKKLGVVPAKYENRQVKVEVKPASTRLETIPAQYETYTERVMISPPRTVWKRGEDVQIVDPNATGATMVPGVGSGASSDKIEKIDGTTGDIMCLVTLPAEYRNITKRRLVKPETTREVPVPAEYRTVTQRVMIQAPSTGEDHVAPKQLTVTRRKMVEPARTVEVVETNAYKTVKQRVLVQRPRLREPDNVPLFTEVNDQPWSTFSLHVSDVSFKLASQSLANGDWPNPTRIRPEEFINAMPYEDPTPSRAEKIACRIDHGAHPFRQSTDLFRIGLRTAAEGRGANQALRLTLLLDTSGSMERQDRAATLHAAMEHLAKQLKPGDTVSLIGFARTPRLLVDQLPGERAAELPGLVQRATTDGGTNLETALQLAAEKARETFNPTAVNRIVLLTDGAANLGDARPAELAKTVVALRETGIAFDACGICGEDLNDKLLEALTRQGDGRYTLLNRPEDADAGFARQLAGAFRPSAKNVKVQVWFNPERVARYRLVGYDLHRLNKEDFRDDSVDAAELAAAESGVALYEVQFRSDEQGGRGPAGKVSIRCLDVDSNEMFERSWLLVHSPAQAFEHSAPGLQLAATAGFLSERLRGSRPGDLVDLQTLAQTATRLRLAYPHEPTIKTLESMVEQTRALER